MPKVTAVCYLSSLLFYGMGYSKTLAIENPFTVNTYEFTMYVSLATVYFVLAIFLSVIGSVFFYLLSNREQELSLKSKPLKVKRKQKGNRIIEGEQAI